MGRGPGCGGVEWRGGARVSLEGDRSHLNGVRQPCPHSNRFERCEGSAAECLTKVSPRHRAGLSVLRAVARDSEPHSAAFTVQVSGCSSDASRHELKARKAGLEAVSSLVSRGDRYLATYASCPTKVYLAGPVVILLPQVMPISAAHPASPFLAPSHVLVPRSAATSSRQLVNEFPGAGDVCPDGGRGVAWRGALRLEPSTPPITAKPARYEEGGFGARSLRRGRAA